PSAAKASAVAWPIPAPVAVRKARLPARRPVMNFLPFDVVEWFGLSRIGACPPPPIEIRSRRRELARLHERPEARLLPPLGIEIFRLEPGFEGGLHARPFAVE